MAGRSGGGRDRVDGGRKGGSGREGSRGEGIG